jgi:hypothetical protein
MKYKEFLRMLFDAPDAGGDGGNGNNGGKDGAGNNGGNGGTGNGNNEPEKRYTDADVNAIIDKKFAEWQKKQQKAVDEATKLANMTAQEKAEHERDAWEQKYNDLLAENTRSTLTIQATQMLTDDGIVVPTEIVSVLVAEDAEKTKARVTAFAKAFKTAVQNAVKEANKKESPKSGGASTLTKSSIMKVKDINERQRLIRENLDLFSKN